MNVLEHLQKLVSFDTRNPPRNITGESPIFEYLSAQLTPGFELEVEDLGDGCVSLFATRGEPKTLFNFHVDTVPADEGWERNPLELEIMDERAVGLGACDIKGASACMLAALDEVDPENVALLFTSDEEAGSSRCVKHFLASSDQSWDLVVVAEPTMGRAVVEHRGIATARAHFSGVSGHASSGLADKNSALHHAVRWANAALDYATAREDDIRLNLGHLVGGVKPNMIASEAHIWWGFRPLPTADSDSILSEIEALVSEDARVEWQQGFRAPALPSVSKVHDVTERVERALKKAEARGLEPGAPVDFWTEAALFSAYGYDTVVYGPGDIARAHTAGEWVGLDQLQRVTADYVRMLGTT